MIFLESKKTSVCSLCSLVFFPFESQNTVKISNWNLFQGFFVSWSEFVCSCRTGECSDVHGKVAETAMNRALLANFVSANFPSRDICGFEEFCDSLSTRSYLRDPKSKRKSQIKRSKKVCIHPKATSLPVQRILSTKRTLWPDSPGGTLPSLISA